MLAAMLLAGIVAAPLCSLALFLPVPRPRRVAGVGPALRRFALALGGTALGAVVVVAVLNGLDVPAPRPEVAAGAFVVTSLVWLPPGPVLRC